MSENNFQFVDLVKPEFVLTSISASSREEALIRMAEFLVEKGNCRPSFIEAIVERERNHPSGLPMPGPKIAIPHTDAEHVLQSVILFVRLPEPVEFLSMGSPDDKLQVRMISMFALKEKKRIGDMLETLINVYQREEVLNAILEAENADGIYKILRDAVELYGV
jgi:PTS system galactitol-specific IIA component